MIINLKVKTESKTAAIESINAVLENGDEVDLTWEESDISRVDDGFSQRCEDVYIDGENADGEGEILKDLRIIYVTLVDDSEEWEECLVDISEMEICDGDETYYIPPNNLTQSEGMEDGPCFLEKVLAYKGSKIIDTIIEEFKRQINAKEHVTSSGELEGIITLDNGRTIEIIIMDNYYSAILYYSKEEKDNNDLIQTFPWITKHFTNSFSDEELGKILRAVMVSNDSHVYGGYQGPWIRKYITNSSSDEELDRMLGDGMVANDSCGCCWISKPLINHEDENNQEN